MKLTNTTRGTINLVKKDGKVKDGVPETVAIGPGATEDVDVDINRPAVQGHLIAGTLFKDERTQQRAAEAAAPAAAPKR